MIHKASLASSMTLVLALAGAPAQTVSGAIEPESIVQTTGSSDEESRALAFRRTFGLDANLDVIRRAATSDDYAVQPYGVPLSLDERREMVRRAHVEETSVEAATFGAAQASWAGYYFDQHARGAPVFLFTKGIDAMRSEIARLLPDESEFRVEQVARPLSSLHETQDAIVAAFGELRESGIKITSAGIDLVGNRVTVGLDGVDEQASDTISGRFDSDIVFKDSPAAISDACPDTACRQIKGGIRISSVAVGTAKACTAGFIVRRTIDDSLAVLTAGHCLWAQTTTPFGDAWYHATSSGSNTTFGLGRYHGFHDNSFGDVGLIEIDPDETTYDNSPNRIWTDGDGVQMVTALIADANQTVGSQACSFGAFSNDHYCGAINDADETKLSEATPAWGAKASYDILHTKVYDYNLIPGDSGGPIYRVQGLTSGEVAVLGTHVHSLDGPGHAVVQNSSGWYTPYALGELSYYQSSGYVDRYNVCITAAC